MLNINLSSSFTIFRNKTFRKIIGTSFLFLTYFALGSTQSAEISKTPEALFSERNNKPYTLEDIQTHITPILDQKIAQDFWPFIEVLFDRNFPNPIHSPLVVFKNWNRFFEKLKNAEDAINLEELHPQIKILRTDIICHHYCILAEKYPLLADKAYS